jgi:hypothetical protein
VRPEDDPAFNSQGLAELVTSMAHSVEEKLSRCRANPPDAAKHPVTKLIVDVYLFCLEVMANDMRRGVIGLREQFETRPNLRQSIEDLESWLFRPKKRVSKPKLTVSQEREMGDFLVGKMNFSFSRALTQIESFKRSINPKGAPSKKAQTLLMLDARVANGWSYFRIASELCDCEKRKHDKHCADSIRKRIKELEAFLAKYKIVCWKQNETPEKTQL